MSDILGCTQAGRPILQVQSVKMDAVNTKHSAKLWKNKSRLQYIRRKKKKRLDTSWKQYRSIWEKMWQIHDIDIVKAISMT